MHEIKVDFNHPVINYDYDGAYSNSSKGIFDLHSGNQ